MNQCRKLLSDLGKSHLRAGSWPWKIYADYLFDLARRPREDDHPIAQQRRFVDAVSNKYDCFAGHRPNI